MFNEGGFSSTVASNQAEDSSTWDSKRDVLQRMLISKPAAEVLDVDD
jgi:hypothetical protein